jgi:PAS domain S-box-containing protein
MTDRADRDARLAELLVQNSVDGLFAIDLDHRYTLWNRSMESFSEKPASEVLGRRVFDVFPFLRTHGLDAAMARSLEGETVTADAVPYVVPGRPNRYHDRHYVPLRGDHGAIVGMIGIVRDVTARRDAEDALRASEAHLRMAVEAAGVGIWSWNVRADEVTWSEPMKAIFGLASGTAPAGRERYLALIHPDDRARSAERITQGIAEGRWEDEYRIVRADGAVRWVMAKGTVLGDVVLGAVLDVTERHHREEQQRQAQKLEAVGQLTAGIAHNFNNMLMGMLPNLELAARTAPPDLEPLLRDAEQAAERAAHLVRQLMTYAGRNRPTARTVESMSALAERTVGFCRTTFDQRLAFHAHYDPTARVRVDPAQIEQALLNILINARDAIADVDTPRVTLDVDIVRDGATELGAHAGDFVRVRVADNGIGIDATTASQLFEPFFTTKAVGKGTGLGLATTRTIMVEHGGFVACDSSLGRGATFSLYLPHASAAHDETRPVVEPPSTRGTELVLVVDDEAPIRHVVSLMLTDAGFRVEIAASGEHALAILSDPRIASAVAVVLLDVSMPGMSGRELRARIREIAPHARVVYFTGYAFEAPDANDAVLEKPASEKRLLGTIRDVLDR